MITVRNLMQLEQMKNLELIAGKGGLENEVKKIGILDYEFTQRGTTYFNSQNWLPGEFILSSFMYAAENPNLLLDAVRRLVRKKCPGLAIRNVFRIPIAPDLIRFANQNDFPVFIIHDHTLFFEDIIIAVNDLNNRARDNALRERKIKEILYSHMEAPAVKNMARELNYAIDDSFCVYFIAPRCADGRNELKRLILRGIRKVLYDNGDAIAPFNDGAFYIHSINQSGKKQYELADYIFTQTGINARLFHVGISEQHFFLLDFKAALLQSYYAAYFAGIYELEAASWHELGIYKILFPAAASFQLSGNTVEDFIKDYDMKSGSDFWNTLAVYEKNGGDVKLTSAELSVHENTVRYRIKKIFELFGKDPNDKNFEAELLVAVKLHRIKSIEDSFVL